MIRHDHWTNYSHRQVDGPTAETQTLGLQQALEELRVGV